MEANFVLEITLGQQQASAADAILTLAEQGVIRLVLPAFALSEPFTTIHYRGIDREKIRTSLAQQERELGRSALHQPFAAQLRLILPILATVRKTQMDALEQTVERLLSAGQTIPLDLMTFRQARQLESSYGLSPQDAIVYAVALMHMGQQDPQEVKCFLSRDKDFNDPGIAADLGRFNCRYINNFDDGLRYIQRELNPPVVNSE